MRKVHSPVFLLLLLFCANAVCAQGIMLGDTVGVPSEKAVLDIRSSAKGILIPRVLLVDSNNPIKDAKPIGLMVWNANSTFKRGKGFYFWNGIDWQGLVYYAGDGIAIDSTNLISAPLNGVNKNGIVPAPTTANKNAVYVTDSNGNPAWRTEDKTMYYINKF